MAEWEKQIGAINLIVGNLEHSKAFYREVFGLPLQHEDEDTAMFRFADTYVFLQRGAAHEDGPSSDVLSLAQKGSGNSSSLLTTWTRCAPSWTRRKSPQSAARRTVTGVCAPSPSPIRAATPGRSRKSCLALPAPRRAALSPVRASSRQIRPAESPPGVGPLPARRRTACGAAAEKSRESARCNGFFGNQAR
jgi:Glyoxalase/Bleomycin resistance protein/Dioxygenase superfamily